MNPGMLIRPQAMAGSTWLPNSMEVSLSMEEPGSSESSGERRLSTLARQMCRKRSASRFSCAFCLPGHFQNPSTCAHKPHMQNVRHLPITEQDQPQHVH